jgi:16S rRNA (cytosine967-C5)-methyltransferase
MVVMVLPFRWPKCYRTFDMKPSAPRTPRAEQLAITLWTKIRMDWGFASDAIAQAFRKDRSLASSERRFVSETLYGMIRQARRIDFALERAGAKTGPGPERERARLFAYLVLAGELDAEQAAKVLPGIDFARVAAVDDAIAKERGAERRLGLGQSLPDWLARRLLAQFGAEAQAVATGLSARAPLTLRANRLKTTREALAERLAAEDRLVAHPTRFAPDGLVMESRTNVFGLRAFHDGWFEAQDEASQLVAEVCAPAGAGLVVDACAGAGGKSLALGALMRGKGRLVALDVDDKKLEELRRRARRAGLTNVRAVRVAPTGGFPDEVENLAGKAERVLVDAPCTGLGALRRNPEARWRIDEADLAAFPARQLAIARRAAALCAPEGLLIYATCSIMTEENQAVAARLGAALPEFSPVPIAEILGPERAAALAPGDGLALATRPDRHDTDGFFAQVFRRSARK